MGGRIGTPTIDRKLVNYHERTSQSQNGNNGKDYQVEESRVCWRISIWICFFVDRLVSQDQVDPYTGLKTICWVGHWPYL